MGQMCITDAGTTQDNFIPPAPPVGGLPISQDWLDRMKLVHDRTVPIIKLSAHTLAVETGRYRNIERMEQICMYCNLNTNEDEYILLECPSSDNLRS